MKNTLRLTLAAFGLAIFNLSAATLYVALESPNPVSPYATWATAATNIQHAVDAANTGDTVLLTNGVYMVGSRDVLVWQPTLEPPQFASIGLSRVVITNAIRLESVNGPLVTTVDGGGGVRCVYLGDNAVLSGFTLTNGYAYLGGGVRSVPSGVVTNCTLTGNRALRRGLGVHGGRLYNCTVTGNSYISLDAGDGGGGAFDSILYNCTLTGALGGGGATKCTLYNCTLTRNSDWGAAFSTLYNCLIMGNDGGSDGQFFNCTVIGNNGGVSGTVFNSKSFVFNSIIYYNIGGNFAEGATLNSSCTTPLPTNGVGNITGPPLFMDMAAGDFRLREDSPCIDAGTNLMGFPVREWRYVSDEVGSDWVVVGHITDPIDMLGNTRFIDGNGDGTVAWDMGVYEFNSYPPLRFTCPPQRMPDCWRLSITGAPNKWVHLQRSSDLKNWENCWPYVFMGAEGACQWDDGDTEQKAMFYRALVP